MTCRYCQTETNDKEHTCQFCARNLVKGFPLWNTPIRVVRHLNELEARNDRVMEFLDTMGLAEDAQKIMGEE